MTKESELFIFLKKAFRVFTKIINDYLYSK